MFLQLRESSTEAAMEFETNLQIHILRVRLRQVIQLISYLKSFQYEDESKKNILKRLVEIFKILNSKFENFADEFKKLQDKELRKLEKVKKSDRKFQKGHEVGLFWIEYDENGDEKTRCDFTDFKDSDDETYFWGYEQFKVKIGGKVKLMRRFLLRMDKEEFKSLPMSEKQMRPLVVKSDGRFEKVVHGT